MFCSLRQRLLVWLGIWLFGFAVGGARAETPEMLFQSALMAEKGMGDLKRAAAIYEKVVGHGLSGQADAQIAVRARKRLALLKGTPDVYGLAGDGRQADTAATALRGFAPGASVRVVQGAGSLQATGALAQQIQEIGASEGLRRKADAAPAFTQRAPDAVRFFQDHLSAIRKALGIQGLAERYRAAYEKRRTHRPGHAADFYQAGLFAEREHGDVKTALKAYQAALPTASPDMKRRILTRLHSLQSTRDRLRRSVP